MARRTQADPKLAAVNQSHKAHGRNSAQITRGRLFPRGLVAFRNHEATARDTQQPLKSGRALKREGRTVVRVAQVA